MLRRRCLDGACARARVIIPYPGNNSRPLTRPASERGRELAGKLEAGDGNAVRFLYRTIETRRNVRDEPFKGARNLTHCEAYVKAVAPARVNMALFVRHAYRTCHVNYQFLKLETYRMY